MRFRYRATVIAGAAALLCGALVSPSSAAPAPAAAGVSAAGAGPVPAMEFEITGGQIPAGQAAGFTDPGALAYADCDSGYICFFSGASGGGNKCQWSAALISSTNCSWMNGGTPAKSVYNRTSHRYHYYLDSHYNNRLGSTLSGAQGNLTGNYTVGSLCRHNASGCQN